MSIAASADVRTVAGESLKGLRGQGFRRLQFLMALEQRFEDDSRKVRSHRMWLDGLIAIVVLNACLLIDYLIVKDPAWLLVVRQTAIITPLALAVNLLMRANPVRWVREGSVAAAVVVICYINLFVEGNKTTTAAMFSVICLLITALFAGVVMRLRFRYAATTILLMLLGGLWTLGHAPTLSLAETVVGGSMMVVGLGIILVATYSLEREERMSFLLGLERDLQAEQLEISNTKLQHLSSVDVLTGLPNRRALEDRFEELWRECGVAKKPLSVIVIDLDNFKFVNDVYGHLHGDEALRRIGSLLSQALRGTSDMAARFGGEEFVLLLPYADEEKAMIVGERVRKLVEMAGTPLIAHPSGVRMLWTTVSCGVSSCMPEGAEASTNVIASADYALYAAKRAGRNRVVYRACEEMPPIAASEGMKIDRQVAGRRRAILAGTPELF
jgi:diguanylate cyclase (GGDEF)-like protein